jgi:hypothetical protein
METSETAQNEPKPEKNEVQPVQQPAVEGQVLPVQKDRGVLAPFSDAATLAAERGALGSYGTAAFVRAALESSQLQARQHREETIALREELAFTKDKVSDMRVELAVAEGKLASARGAKRWTTTIAIVGSVLAGKGWTLLDKPGMENIAWGLIFVGGAAAAIAAILAWKRSD